MSEARDGWMNKSNGTFFLYFMVRVRFTAHAAVHLVALGFREQFEGRNCSGLN